MLAGLRSFDVRRATCFDPNDQERIARIIAAVGRDRFNERIHALAQKWNAWEPMGSSASLQPPLPEASQALSPASRRGEASQTLTASMSPAPVASVLPVQAAVTGSLERQAKAGYGDFETSF